MFGEDTIEEVIAEEKAADRKMANGADRIVEKNSARIQKKEWEKNLQKNPTLRLEKVKNTDLKSEGAGKRKADNSRTAAQNRKSF